jgi:peptidoglycan-associated lipoprotein
MKLIKVTKLAVLGMVLALAATGCKHKTPPTTPLKSPGGVTGETPNVGPGGTIAGPSGETPSGTSLTGIPQGAGHPGWPENAEIFKSDTVHFAFDSSVVRPEEKSKVGNVADYLKANSGSAVKIEGHCDERGTEEYNRALGERRALALREILVGLGLDPERVDTISYGKDRPENPGHDESAWRANRRGVFILLTPPTK